MSDVGQLPSEREPQRLAGGLLRRLHSLRPRQISCMTLYAMHLASGVPVDFEPGVCPVCGSTSCKLVRALERRGLAPSG